MAVHRPASFGTTDDARTPAVLLNQGIVDTFVLRKLPRRSLERPKYQRYLLFHPSNKGIGDTYVQSIRPCTSRTYRRVSDVQTVRGARDEHDGIKDVRRR